MINLSQQFPTVTQCINEISRHVHNTALSKGWYEDEDNLIEAVEKAGIDSNRIVQLVTSEKLLLSHSEISEGVEYMRANNANDDKLTQFLGIEVEMADAIIRLLDLAARRGYRIGEAMEAKMVYNMNRPHKHGGKKF